MGFQHLSSLWCHYLSKCLLRSITAARSYSHTCSGLDWYMWGRRIRGQVTSRSQRGGQCPHRLLQLVSCHQTKVLLIANSWTAKGLANERRDGVMVFAERSGRVPVQIKKSFGPAFVWGSRFGQWAGPSRDRDLEDLSRASAAFRNKLVGETALYGTAVDHSGWKGSLEWAMKKQKPESL